MIKPPFIYPIRRSIHRLATFSNRHGATAFEYAITYLLGYLLIKGGWILFKTLWHMEW